MYFIGSMWTAEHKVKLFLCMPILFNNNITNGLVIALQSGMNLHTVKIGGVIGH